MGRLAAPDRRGSVASPEGTEGRGGNSQQRCKKTPLKPNSAAAAVGSVLGKCETQTYPSCARPWPKQHRRLTPTMPWTPSLSLLGCPPSIREATVRGPCSTRCESLFQPCLHPLQVHAQRRFGGSESLLDGSTVSPSELPSSAPPPSYPSPTHTSTGDSDRP